MKTWNKSFLLITENKKAWNKGERRYTVCKEHVWRNMQNSAARGHGILSCSSFLSCDGSELKTGMPYALHARCLHTFWSFFPSEEDLVRVLSPADWGVLYWRIYQNKQIYTSWRKYCPGVWWLLPITGPDCLVQAAFVVLLTNVPTLSTGAALFHYGFVPVYHIPHLKKKHHGRLGEQLQTWEPNRWNGMNEIPHIKFLLLVLFLCCHTPIFLKMVIIINRDGPAWHPGLDLGWYQQNNGGLNMWGGGINLIWSCNKQK